MKVSRHFKGNRQFGIEFRRYFIFRFKQIDIQAVFQAGLRNILKQVIESEGVLGKSDSVKADRDKIRAGLAKLKETDGLLGRSQRTADREAIKPFLFVQAKDKNWQVVHTPVQ